MNTCQAIFRADGSKASTTKSTGVKKALLGLLNKSSGSAADSSLIITNFKQTPDKVMASAKKVIVEFAGAKFHVKSTTGDQYIQYINKGVINHLASSLSGIDHVVICEEKYQFTPDDLKANTRQKRQKKETISISHLKEELEILSESKLSKKAIVSTAIGKSLISSYLSKHGEELSIQKDMTLDIDSEAVMCLCYYGHSDKDCVCKPYSIPVRFKFLEGKMSEKTHLSTIRQRKGEAEMTVVDWIPEMRNELSAGDSIVSYVTSADIDTVLIHIFALSLYWDRDEDGNFKWPVYVWLQKTKPEIFDITGIIRAIEKQFEIADVAAIISLILCMSGNDFLPNFYNMSHHKLLSIITGDTTLLEQLFTFQRHDRKIICHINCNVYVEIIKKNYCPANLQHTKLTAEEVRQLSIKRPNKDFRHPQSWMPPMSGLKMVAKLVQCQIDYMLTVWCHESLLPDFKSYGCIMRSDAGEIIYDMGPDMHVEDKDSLLILSDTEMETAIGRAKVVKVKTGTKKQQNADVTHPTEEGPRDDTHMMLTSTDSARNRLTGSHHQGTSHADTCDPDRRPLDENNHNKEAYYNRKTSGKRQQAWTPVKSPQAKRVPAASTPR